MYVSKSARRVGISQSTGGFNLSWWLTNWLISPSGSRLWREPVASDTRTISSCFWRIYKCCSYSGYGGCESDFNGTGSGRRRSCWAESIRVFGTCGLLNMKLDEKADISKIAGIGEHTDRLYSGLSVLGIWQLTPIADFEILTLLWIDPQKGSLQV